MAKEAAIISYERSVETGYGDNLNTCVHQLGTSTLEIYYDPFGGLVHYDAQVQSG